MFYNFYKDKKVLVTGHTGFKGSWLSIWLNMLGAYVYGYSLFPAYKPNNYTLSNIYSFINEKIADIRIGNSVNIFLKKVKPEIVFHLAAQPIVRESYLNPKETYEVNVLGLVNLFQAVRKIDSIRKIVIITSDKCYENVETNKGYKENDKLGGSDPYSSSKACAEIITTAYYRSFFKNNGIAVATVRAGNVIGGGDWSKFRLIPDCVRSITKNKDIVLRNPNSTRPWQYVLEPLSGYLWLGVLLGNDYIHSTGNWNFGPEKSSKATVKEVVNKFVSYWSKKVQIITNTNNDNLYESKLLHLSISKAKKELSWKPVWNLYQTIEKTAEWYIFYYENKTNMLNYCRKQISQYSDDAKKKKIMWSI